MFESIEITKALVNLNFGSESTWDSTQNTYVVRVLAKSIKDVKIPKGYILYAGEVYSADMETKICRLELPPLSDGE